MILSKEEQEQLFDDNISIADSFARKYYKTPYWEFDEAIQLARTRIVESNTNI